MLPEFPEADFYSCIPDCESLHLDDPEEAIVEYFDSPQMLEYLRDGCVVVCYRRQAIPDTFGFAVVDDIVELLDEHHLVEELQDPDARKGMFASSDDVETLKSDLAVVIQKMADVVTPWACEVSAKVEMSGEQVEAFLRKARPELFEEEPNRG